MTRRRSWMFVPGDRGRFLDKLRTLSMDVVILDLEDGVPAGSKQVARERIGETLRDGGISASIFVRTNNVGTSWFMDDMAHLLQSGIDGLVLPKITTSEEVAGVATLLTARERELGRTVGETELVVTIESARGLLRAPEIAESDERVTWLMFGSEDFALDMGMSTKRRGDALELLHARSSLVVAARSANVGAVDGIFPDYSDPAGLERDADLARSLGFDGKTLFHPAQIGPINRVFSPTADEVEYAREVVTAFEEATARGDATVAVGGQLVDLPIVHRAQQIIAHSTE